MKTAGIVTQRVLFALALAMPFAHAAAHAADTFIKPSKEELEMNEMPGYPGAAAVILTLDEEDNDLYHYKKYYKRIKVLTEKGKDQADVEIGFTNSVDSDAWAGNEDKQVTDIQARTIHPDGTVVPFSGKPYLKTIEKNSSYKFQAKVFTLPDVQIGDIIEYRYTVRIADNFYEAPDWYIQGELYVKSAHFTWMPTTVDLEGPDGGTISSITWFPILPKGANIVNRDLPGGGQQSNRSGAPERVFELSVKDIAPAPSESFMPPTAAFTYRVLFNFSEYHSPQEYWTAEGKRWSKAMDNFANPNGDLRNAAQSITAGATSNEDKLKKLYDAVEQMENTDYTRQHGKQEDKAAGFGKISNAADVYARKRGSSVQLTLLMVGLARAAGMKAYVAAVPDRTHHVFVQSWLNTSQLDDEIAIVNVDGKDVYLDPGERYTPYGHLAWKHTFVQGLREMDGGTAIAATSGDGYKYNRTSRVANLKMDDRGEASGDVTVTYSGSVAVQWRQRALEGDEESIRHSLRTSMEKELPRSLDVKVKSIENLTEYEQPLKITYSVKGAVGSATGTRLLLPADLFTSSEEATFPQEKREMAVYFHFPQIVQDALGITLPPSMKIEATPDTSKLSFQHVAGYGMSVETTPTHVTTRRDFVFGEVIVPKEDYPALRTFYSQFQGNDKQQIVLKLSGSATPVTAETHGSDVAN